MKTVHYEFWMIVVYIVDQQLIKKVDVLWMLVVKAIFEAQFLARSIEEIIEVIMIYLTSPYKYWAYHP